MYVGLFLSQLGNMPEGAGFGSLTEISAMFSNPYVLAAGWIHYLAFDLFVGAWEVFDSQKNNIPHWYIVPRLFLTLMLGPVGLAPYLSIRGILTKISRFMRVFEKIDKLFGSFCFSIDLVSYLYD